MDAKFIVVNYYKHNFLEESSEDEEINEKIDNYAELTVPLMTNKQFKQNFRITTTTFEDLLRKATLVYNRNNSYHMGFPKTSIEKELLTTIWYLGNMESLRSVAERFGISKSTCWDVVYRTSALLSQINMEFKIISWPNRERQEEIRNSFARNGFPGIIGCIDGSHIRINAPKKFPNSYVNRKSFHSLLLQGVCDHKMLFTDIYTGEAGSIHDYTLFKKSDLYHRIINRQISFYEDGHILGDLAYRLATFLLTNYKKNIHLNALENNYNKILNRARVTIERAFAFLKGRFRRLKYLETVRLDLAVYLILASCILHNICILNNDFANDIINEVEELQNEQGNNPQNIQDFIDVDIDNRNALIKRNNICNALPMFRNNR